MNMHYDLKQIKRIVMDQLMNEVDQGNDGRVIGPRRHVSVNDLRLIKEHDVQIKRLPNESNEAVLINGAPVWNIKRRYASRKVNGSYKQLRPAIVPYVVDPYKDEWAKINAALASVDVEKAKSTAYHWKEGER